MNDSDTNQLHGGSLLVAWQLKDKHVLIVGGGEVASQRIESVLAADAFITILCPEKGLHPRTRHLIDLRADRITYYDRRFSGSAELQKMDMVLTAIDDVTRSREICELCRKAKVPVNAADIPDSCDFYFGSQIRDGPLQIMISTNGNGPRMASLIKAKLQSALSGKEGKAIEMVGLLRAQLKQRAPGVGGKVGRQRMKWMTQLCNTWEMEDFTQLDDAMIKRLLDDGWEQSRVPTFEEMGGRQRRIALHLPVDRSSLWLSAVTPFVLGVLCTALVLSIRRR